MVGDVHAVHRLVGNNEGLGGIALHIGEYVVDLYRIGELTEGMEGRAKSGGRVDYGIAAGRKLAESGDLAGVGLCVHIPGNDKVISALGKILHYLDRAKQPCGRALVVKVGIEKDKRLFRVCVLEAGGGQYSRTAALISAKCRAGNVRRGGKPAVFKGDKLKLMLFEGKNCRFTSPVGESAAADDGVIGMLINKPRAHIVACLLKADDIGRILAYRIKYPPAAVGKGIYAVRRRLNSEIESAYLKLY